MGARGNGGLSPEDLKRILDVARRKALTLGANTHEADDVAQLTATKLYFKWNSSTLYKTRGWNEARWDGYVRKVAKNVYKDEIRSYHRRMARQTRAAGGNVPIMHRSGMVSSPESPSGVDSYLARALLAEEILNLPKTQRAVAIRMFIEEKPVSEVAQELGIQQQSVRKHVRTARAMLKQRLEEANRPQVTEA